MQDHVKFLVIDDVRDWAQGLEAAVRAYFAEACMLANARIRSFTAYDADQADVQITVGGWDLVLLDMNLDVGAKRGGRRLISGLDLLGEIAAGNKAYFVIIVTGAVTDPTLERAYGRETAGLIRFGALNEAVKLMPASRVRILHKPKDLDAANAVAAILPHLHSALDQYCSVSLERNVFRALPGDPKLLEICYNGGPRITLPFEEPFRMVQSALAQPNMMIGVNQLMQLLAGSSARGGVVIVDEGSFERPARTKGGPPEDRGHQDDEVTGQDKLDWTEMSGFTVSRGIHAPVATPKGVIPIESIIGALMYARRNSHDLSATVKTFVANGYPPGALLAVPGIAREWIHKGREEAEEEFRIDDAFEQLNALVAALQPVLKPLAEEWLRDRSDKATENKRGKQNRGAIRIQKREETKHTVLARKNWERFKKRVKSHPALMEFYEHITTWMPRDDTTRGHLYYRPPCGGSFYPYWLTK